MDRERKTVKFEVKQVDEEEGIIEGYGSTFTREPDAYGDIVEAGAFTKTIKENADTIVSLFNHNISEPIGKPTLSVDKKGLFASIKIVRGVQKAEETLLLAKAGVITRMSIGYNTIKDSWEQGTRHLKEVRLFDVSPVVFAANEDATVTNVKAATTFTDLSLADRDRAWDGPAAERRVREWAGGIDDMNWNKYRQAFFWYDAGDPELLGSYKLGFADIIDGKLTAIPRGIFAVAAVLMGARGGVDIPEADAAKVKSHVEKYYAKMRKEFDDEDIVAPWNKSAEGATEPTDEKSGRVLSAANKDLLERALEALQNLLEAATIEEEGEKAAPNKETVELEEIISNLKAENEGFDAKQAEERIEQLLQQLQDAK